MLKLQVVAITSRTLSIEIENSHSYYLPNKVNLYVEQKRIETLEKNVWTINHLEPATAYTLYVEDIETKEKSQEITVRTKPESATVDVRKFGAIGDGVTLDTSALQAAILACPENGRVLIPKGTYLTTPLFLKSNINLHFEKDAVLLGVKERDRYPVLQGVLTSYDELEEYYLGSWEGDPMDSYASLLTGIHVENINIIGEGILDGNASFETWWERPKEKRRAWRPRTIFLTECKNVLVEGITIKNSPSWTVHPLMCEDLKFINLRVENPPDSPNTDGINPESCKNVLILGTLFSVGDDCIAIKSGKLYMGKKKKMPSQNIFIRNCFMEYGHGAVTIGSEMSGGVNHIYVEKCLFQNTDRGIRIKTRRGRGETGIIDEIHVQDIQMDGVLTPFVINAFYFCDIDGHVEYVWSKEPLPVDERTPYIKNIYLKNIRCKNAEVAAAFFYGLPERKIEKIDMEDIYVDFRENAKPGYAAMMDFIEPMCRNGFYFHNINHLKLKNIQAVNTSTEAVIKLAVDHEGIEEEAEAAYK
ncbi:MAG: glycoside hydrolase family 28 protein [Bacillota bacterium]